MMNRKQRRTEAKQNRNVEKKVSLSEAMAYAIKLHQQDKLNQAEKIYQQILQADPDFIDALHFLGVLAHKKGRSEEAIKLIKKAVKINPSYADAYNNLGNVLKETGKFNEAEDAYRSSLALIPDNIDTLSNLGGVLRENNKYDEALTYLEQAISIAPEHPWAHHNLGNVLKKLNRRKDAISAYKKSISLLHPKYSKTYVSKVYSGLVRVLFLEDSYDEAATVLKQWLDFEPDSPTALHMLSACTGQNIPDRASDAFVEEIFDDFSGSFDKVLKRLDYQAPELVFSAVKSQVTQVNKQWMVLDAGCGTGLCGLKLKDYAKQLIGVDLSKGMIDKARGHNIYDELITAELTHYVQEHPDTYHLIASADTLCYFGDLSNVLQGASSALKEGGILVFTLEKHEDNHFKEGYHLNQHGRYNHSLNYVSNIVKQSGMEILNISTERLRNEAGKPVIGMVVTALK